MKKYFLNLIKRLHTLVDSIWYLPLISVLAAVDNFVLVVPTDGIMASSTMLQPKRWGRYWLTLTFGSSVGTILLAAVTQSQGLNVALQYFPDLQQGWVWQYTEQLFVSYGLLIVALIAMTPVILQPAAMLAAVAQIPLPSIFVAVLVGRLVKFFIIGYLASHAPQKLAKLWGIQDELKDLGIDTSRT